MEAWPPMKRPLGFCSTMNPLALRLPRICEGFGSLMRFQTIDEDEGWAKIVLSPRPMLKLCQLITARSEVLIVRIEPAVLKVALPWPTVPPTGLASPELQSKAKAKARAAQMRPLPPRDKRE